MANVAACIDLKKALRKKGFVEEEGSKHTKYYLMIDGKDIGINTLVSRSWDDVSSAMQAEITRQLRMPNTKFLVDYIQCKNSLANYEKELIKLGLVDPPKLPL